MEARAGLAPADGGFADRSLGSLGTVPKCGRAGGGRTHNCGFGDRRFALNLPPCVNGGGGGCRPHKPLTRPALFERASSPSSDPLLKRAHGASHGEPRAQIWLGLGRTSNPLSFCFRGTAKWRKAGGSNSHRVSPDRFSRPARRTVIRLPSLAGSRCCPWHALTRLRFTGGWVRWFP